MLTPQFWEGRRVLLTGHTGFKGGWAGIWLSSMGAKVYGLSLAPSSSPNLSNIIGTDHLAGSIMGDVRKLQTVSAAVEAARPDIVIHMAAQALVRESYRDPVTTFDTNVLGTVHLLDALRRADGLKGVLIVTSDKVYENRDDDHCFTESDRLGGDDPYSASKAAAEVVVQAYAKSYFQPLGIPIATARAGNVIGGGDWSADRLLPDIWRASQIGETVELRYPQSTRPWQHVLEPLSGYFTYVEHLLADADGRLPRAMNFGPNDDRSLTVAEVADRMNRALGLDEKWQKGAEPSHPEKTKLAIDASLAHTALQWRAKLTAEEAVQWTADWYKAHGEGAAMFDYSMQQIAAYSGR